VLDDERAMKGVVTGASGFVASHVADELSAAGHEIVAFDVRPDPRHKWVGGDLLDLPGLRKAFRGADFVCHLAAVGDVYLAAQRPTLAAAVNVTGTSHVCEAALAENVGRVVLASTWEVYGKPQYEPMDEAHPCHPDHPYSITKLAGEQMALAFGALRNLDVVVLRLGTTYGLRMRANSVFSIFIARALARQPITIQGSGEQARQFTHARDVARAFVLALSRGRNNGVYNIVADKSVTIRELASVVTQLVPTTIEYREPRPGDVPSALVTSALARRELDWSPEVDFAQGVHEIVEEIRASSSGQEAAAAENVGGQ